MFRHRQSGEIMIFSTFDVLIYLMNHFSLVMHYKSLELLRNDYVMIKFSHTPAQNSMPKYGRFHVKRPTSGLVVMTGSQKVHPPKFHSNRIMGLGDRGRYADTLTLDLTLIFVPKISWNITSFDLKVTDYSKSSLFYVTVLFTKILSPLFLQMSPFILQMSPLFLQMSPFLLQKLIFDICHRFCIRSPGNIIVRVSFLL